MTEQGNVVIERKIGALGVEQEIVRWTGGPEMTYDRFDLMYLPGVAKSAKGDYLSIGTVLRIGPYKARIIRYVDPIWQTAVVLRRDDGIAILKVWAYRVTRWLDRIYRRLIITAAVWDLAYYRERSVPSWRDLKIVRRISRKVVP